ncbi:MAG: hypothetical protein KKF68_00770 [Nanoarchaeota archaeon]|nr:hypothetical protein [Nanoarchaeota archaeon]
MVKDCNVMADYVRMEELSKGFTEGSLPVYFQEVCTTRGERYDKESREEEHSRGVKS